MQLLPNSIVSLHISILEDYLVKWLFLLAVTDFLVVVFNTAVFPFLLGVEGCQGFIEQFVICLLDGSVAVFGVQMRSFRVNIFCCVGATVMGNNTFAGHCADGSFYGYHLRNYDDFNQNTFRRLAAGFVTFVKSNAKALLTLRIKSALRSPRGYAASAEACAVLSVMWFSATSLKAGMGCNDSAATSAPPLPPTGRENYENPLCHPSRNLRISRWGREMRGLHRKCNKCSIFLSTLRRD